MHSSYSVLGDIGDTVFTGDIGTHFWIANWCTSLTTHTQKSTVLQIWKLVHKIVHTHTEEFWIGNWCTNSEPLVHLVHFQACLCFAERERLKQLCKPLLVSAAFYPITLVQLNFQSWLWLFGIMQIGNWHKGTSSLFVILCTCDNVHQNLGWDCRWEGWDMASACDVCVNVEDTSEFTRLSCP